MELLRPKDLTPRPFASVAVAVGHWHVFERNVT